MPISNRRVLFALTATIGFATSASAVQAQDIAEKFKTPFVTTSSPNSYGELTDQIFKIDGDYCVPYGGSQPVCLKAANAPIELNKFNRTTLTLKVPANTYQGAEVATAAGWEPAGSTPPFGPSHAGYGYYETYMKPSCVQGQISSFFWVEAPSYGPHEWDVEFPNAPGHTFNDVHFTVHPSGSSVDFALGFNPCSDFHRYGFLWTPGQIVFTVDGKAAHTFTESDLTTSATGFIMANAWTGNPSWGGGPPTQDALNVYRWMRYRANVTSIP